MMHNNAVTNRFAWKLVEHGLFRDALGLEAGDAVCAARLAKSCDSRRPSTLRSSFQHRKNVCTGVEGSFTDSGSLHDGGFF
jgi:hypothetical protein